MNTTTHHVRYQFTDNGNAPHAPVTLIAVPGVTYDTDRSHTAPRQPIIRSAAPRRSPAGVALTAAAQRRVEWVRQALHEIAEGEE